MSNTLTIGEICEAIPQVKNGKLAPNAKFIPVSEGLIVRNAPTKSGLVQITPNQALGILVERVTVNGAVDGYQRNHFSTHARKIARALERGEDVGEVTLGLDGGKLYATDGQHRLIACVISRKPVWAVIRPMTKDKRADRFVSQRSARRVNADTIVLAGRNSIQSYIKDAIAARKNGGAHPWAEIVGEKHTSITMSPNVAYGALLAYTFGVFASGSLNQFDTERINKTFKPKVGDELAQIFLTFGTKQTNPLAYRPAALRAITNASVAAYVRTGKRPDDFARWQKHMAAFDWPGYAWLTRSNDITHQLIVHWNKRLGPDRKVSVLS